MQVITLEVDIKIIQYSNENVNKGNKAEHKAGKEQRRDGERKIKNKAIDIKPNILVITLKVKA